MVGENDVLVRVHAAGCGPDVWHLMTGMPYMARARDRVPSTGRSASEAGTSREPSRRSARTSSDLRPGDEVMGTAEGSFAELCGHRTRTSWSRSRPTSPFEQAAAVPVSGTTALRAVRDEGKVQPGQRVLVHRRVPEAWVARGADREGVRRVRHRREQLRRRLDLRPVDRCGRGDRLRTRGLRGRIAAVGRDRRSLLAVARCHDCAAPSPLKGTLVIVGGDGGGRWTGGFFRGMLRAPVMSLFVGQRLRGLASKVKREDLITLTELIEAGSLTPVIDRTYPLIEAPDAIRHLEEGHARGKIVVTV